MSCKAIHQFVAGATVPCFGPDAQKPREGVTLASIVQAMQVLPHDGVPCDAYDAAGHKRGGLGLCGECQRDVCWLNPWKYRKGHRGRDRKENNTT